MPEASVAAGRPVAERPHVGEHRPVVAELLGLSSEAVLRRWRDGQLLGYRLSTKVLRFRESDVLGWLEARREGPRVSTQ